MFDALLNISKLDSLSFKPNSQAFSVDRLASSLKEVVKPHAVDRRLLRLTTRDQVVRIRGVSFSVDGRPFDCFEQVYPVDGFTFYLSGRTDRQVLPQTRTGTWSISPHR